MRGPTSKFWRRFWVALMYPYSNPVPAWQNQVKHLGMVEDPAARRSNIEAMARDLHAARAEGMSEASAIVNAAASLWEDPRWSRERLCMLAAIAISMLPPPDRTTTDSEGTP